MVHPPAKRERIGPPLSASSAARHSDVIQVNNSDGIII